MSQTCRNLLNGKLTGFQQVTTDHIFFTKVKYILTLRKELMSHVEMQSVLHLKTCDIFATCMWRVVTCNYITSKSIRTNCISDGLPFNCIFDS